MWTAPLEAAAWKGQLDIIKRLKPDPKKDDVNRLLHNSLFRRDMDLVRFWVSLGADINRADHEGRTVHNHVMSSLSWALDPRDHWYGRSDGTDAKRFAQEWFSSGAKWEPKGDDFGVIRKVFLRLTTLRQKEWLGNLTPPVEEHLKHRIGISTDWHRENLGVYLSMLADDGFDRRVPDHGLERFSLRAQKVNSI